MRPSVASLVSSALVALAVVAAPARAQVLKITLKDPKLLKQYKSAVATVDGQQVLVGEHRSGLQISEKNISYPSNGTFEIWIPDTENPKWCPYKVSKGEKSANGGGRSSISINGSAVKNISYYLREQSLWGLTQEYSKRIADIDDLKKQRDGAKRNTQDWNRKQATLIQAMERLRSWLGETCFERAGEKYAKSIDKELKAQKEAKDARLSDAKASIKMVPTPEELVKAGKESFGDSVEFHVQESQHIRIIYKVEVGDERVKGLLEFGETLIDGFRVQFIDPYIADDFKDYIPDGLFSEFFFGPDDKDAYKKFTTLYYGMGWNDEHAEERLKSNGHYSFRQKAPRHIDSNRIVEQSDLDGIVAHTLGHDLVDIHFNQDRHNDTGAWLHEAVGNWLALEYLGRNSVKCLEIRDLEYAKKLLPDGEKSDELLKGTADLYHRLALDKGGAIDALALKHLAQMDDADIAKSYSLFCFIAKSQGEKGQRWLRACMSAAAVPNTFIPQWRKQSEEIFGVKGKDVFAMLDEEWHKFAEQQVGGPVRR